VFVKLCFHIYSLIIDGWCVALCKLFEFDTISFMCSCTRSSFSTTRDEWTTAVYVTVPVNAGHVRRRLASPVTCGVGDIISGRVCPRRGHGAISTSPAASQPEVKYRVPFRSVVDVPPGTLAADKVSDSKFFVSSLIANTQVVLENTAIHSFVPPCRFPVRSVDLKKISS